MGCSVPVLSGTEMEGCRSGRSRNGKRRGSVSGATKTELEGVPLRYSGTDTQRMSHPGGWPGWTGAHAGGAGAGLLGIGIKRRINPIKRSKRF